MAKPWYEHVEWKRIGAWVLLLGAIGYLAAEPVWKSGSAVLAALFVVTALEFAEYRRSVQTHSERPQVREHDLKLFRELIELLPSDGVIKFVGQHNMAGAAFNLEEVEPIDRFIDTWDNPQHEFIDVDVEHARQELMQACRAWSSTLVTETFPIGIGRQWVPRDWKSEDPERYDRVVTQLHDQAQEIVNAYNRLTRIGIRRLLP